jgi:hypothetical protein
MTVNDPVLPLINAVQVTAVLLAGLALAVVLGQYAAGHPLDYVLLMVNGFALACLLLALGIVESYQRWLARGSMGPIYISVAVFAVGIGLSLVMTTVYYVWRRTRIPGVLAWLVAGFNIKYLFLPICHYLFFGKDDGTWLDPDYFAYIPNADNYFQQSVLVQLGIWIVVALFAFGLTRLRLWLRQRRVAAQARQMRDWERTIRKTPTRERGVSESGRPDTITG